MVKKKNGKWHICIDYIDLSKACLKNSLPLSRINQLVDTISGHKFLSFMNAFSGYYQIKMAPKDEEYTSFIINKDIYCYKIMPFSFKNAGAIYQRLVNKVFKDEINWDMEIYVDNILIKGAKETNHVKDMEKAFNTLHRH